MSIAVLALVVASLSALGTTANMLASWASYRRGGPRLKLAVDHRIRGSFGDMDEDDPSTWRAYLHVHVRNRSAAAVEVQDVSLGATIPTAFRLLTEFSGFYGAITLATMLKATVIDGEDQMSIPAFGGVRWVLDEEFTTMARPSFLATHLLLFHVKVTLTNGQEVRSRKMLYLSAKRTNALVHSLRKDQLRTRAASAATLDDALRELETEREAGTG